MPIPNLLHPVDIKIDAIDRAGSDMDDQAREPVPGSRHSSTSVTVPAQVAYFNHSERARMVAGGMQRILGYLLFRYKDLNDLSYTPRAGDRIVDIGAQTDQNLYLETFEDAGHYPDQQGATMVRAFFTDRKPSRTAKDYI